MKIINVAGLIAAAIAVAASGSPATAADLGGAQGGSMKDGYASAPTLMRGAVGPCYFRGDAGYSWARSPDASWPVSTTTNTTNAGPPVTTTSTYSYIGDTITDTKLDSTAFGGVGLGCGSGSRGIRGEVMLNQTGTRGFVGTPLNYTVINNGVPQPPITDPIHSSVKSTTLMFNAYKDLGSFGPVTPYLGAGVGVSYNKMGDVYFTDNPNLTNTIHGDSRMSLAWSLMAGIGYQLNERAILDVGYRYMDYGKAQSGQIDSAGFVNPVVRINDIAAHEFKVGLRYHFGANDAAPSYQPLK